MATKKPPLVTDMLKNNAGLVKKLIILLILFIFVVSFIESIYFQTEEGYTYHYQNTLTGDVDIYTEPGVHLKMPGFSKVSRYKQVMTVGFGDETGFLTRHNSPITVRFADTYTGKIAATFRFKLPTNKKKVQIIHREFRSFDNLVDALLTKTARDVVINTATQYTGEEFFQGALNQFKSALTDQLSYGIYKTERKRVEIEQTALAPVGLGQEDSTQLQKTHTLVWKTLPVVGEDGKFVRLANPLNIYGIEVTQVTIVDTQPEIQLDNLLKRKKELVAARIETVQEQETAKEKAKTAQLNAEIERTKAKQEALKKKELAVIEKQKEVEMAEKQADKEKIEQQKLKDLAEIQKAKELAIAQANREIQEANYKAAQFEAKAIREKGQAEADIMQAKYAARDPEIYMAEMQRDIAKIMYPNLRYFNVSTPHNMVVLGGNKDGNGRPDLLTNLDILSSFATIGTMESLSNRAVEQLVKPPLTQEYSPAEPVQQ